MKCVCVCVMQTKVILCGVGLPDELIWLISLVINFLFLWLIMNWCFISCFSDQKIPYQLYQMFPVVAEIVKLPLNCYVSKHERGQMIFANIQWTGGWQILLTALKPYVTLLGGFQRWLTYFKVNELLSASYDSVDPFEFTEITSIRSP